MQSARVGHARNVLQLQKLMYLLRHLVATPGLHIGTQEERQQMHVVHLLVFQHW